MLISCQVHSIGSTPLVVSGPKCEITQCYCALKTLCLQIVLVNLGRGSSVTTKGRNLKGRAEEKLDQFLFLSSFNKQLYGYTSVCFIRSCLKNLAHKNFLDCLKEFMKIRHILSPLNQYRGYDLTVTLQSKDCYSEITQYKEL